MSEPARLLELSQSHAFRELVQTQPRWSLDDLTGRLVEVSSDAQSASLTFCTELIKEAQHNELLVTWVTTRASTFFPPDMARAGVDLDALIVVRLTESRQLARAADHVLRSGAFGLVVIDFGGPAVLPMGAQSRLLGLVQKHDTTLVLITQKRRDLPSLGSLVSLRAQTSKDLAADGTFRCELDVIKDKRCTPGWNVVEVFDGPHGMR